MNNKEKILAQLNNKKIIIWGARMTGLGAHRFLASRNIKTEFFIDSDIAFRDNLALGLDVIEPINLKNKLNENI